jgi:hypothetical protein
MNCPAKRRKLAAPATRIFNDGHNSSKHTFFPSLETEHNQPSRGQGLQKTAPTLDTLPNEIQQMIFHHMDIFDDDETTKLKLRPGWNLMTVSKRVQANLIAVVEGVQRSRRRVVARALEECTAHGDQYLKVENYDCMMIWWKKSDQLFKERAAEARVSKWIRIFWCRGL